VFSDDIGHKRLARAEEKAAKRSLPMMIYMFPTIFVVILLSGSGTALRQRISGMRRVRRLAPRAKC
jgi:hypothetical protein